MDSGFPHTLSDQAVQVLVVRALKAKVSAANIVDSLVVNHERAVGVLEGGVGCKDRVIRLNNGGGSLGRWVNAEFKLDLLAKVNGQTLHEESTESRTSSTTERVEDKETLKTRAVIRDVANLVQDLINQFFSNGIVTTSVVVASILLAGDHLLGVEQAAVCAGADFIDDVGLEIAVDGSGDIFALTCDTITR